MHELSPPLFHFQGQPSRSSIARVERNTCSLQACLLYLQGWRLIDLPLRASNEGFLFSFSHRHHFSLKGVAGLSFTARIERAHSDRARSESKKDGPAAPFIFF